MSRVLQQLFHLKPKLRLRVVTELCKFGDVNIGVGLGFSCTKRASSTMPSPSPSLRQGLVILHCVPRGRSVPSPSPFVMKVWTYLSMAELPYKIDTRKPFGPKGKTPWITVDGHDVADSQLIIEFLGKKFDKNFSKNYTQEQLALSRCVRIMLEEHVFWGQSIWRMSSDGIKSMQSVFKIPNSVLAKAWIHYWFVPKMSHFAWAHGMGRHSPIEVEQFMIQDLRAVSIILGNKKFISGETPCEDDCGIFGILSQMMWGSPGSPYEKLIKEELSNLRDYCLRMREKFWPNWNDCLAR